MNIDVFNTIIIQQYFIIGTVKDDLKCVLKKNNSQASIGVLTVLDFAFGPGANFRTFSVVYRHKFPDFWLVQTISFEGFFCVALSIVALWKPMFESEVETGLEFPSFKLEDR